MREALLSPLTQVHFTGRSWIAAGPEPWLRCDGLPRSGWLRLQYACGLADPLTRPVLRIVGNHEVRDELLPAAEAGRAVWIGRLPEGVREVWISPTVAPGPFGFRIERFETLSRPRAAAELGRRHLGRSLRYAWGRARGFDEFSRLQARRALGVTPFEHYDGWRAARSRAFDPHFDGRSLTAPPIRFHIVAPDTDAAEALKPMLDAQIWPHWSLGVGAAAPSARDFVLRLGRGDRLAPHALAALAQAAERAPDAEAIYADEDGYDDSGRRAAPRFKPDWSPIFARSGYAGAPFALSGAAWKAGGVDAKAEIAKVRRVLLSRRDPAPLPAPPAPARLGERRRASVIVPTRDRFDLLRACVESLERFEPGADYELIVVDNGSVAAEALAYLAQLQKRATVLRRLEPFNFSALANAGARAARHPFLLFLNDDVEALAPDWLGRLLERAAAPETGAVGAKLLYPDGRLQHGGVVLGLDGAAGHAQRLAGADDPGYLGSLAFAREVSAVTGACLAVEARKFFAVGGFDEERLPVEFSDIDLCLRLSEAGFVSVFEPQARLMHHESATRGINLWLDSRYAEEHATFRARWGRRLRDDPYFHPALSLDALGVALG